MLGFLSGGLAPQHARAAPCWQAIRERRGLAWRGGLAPESAGRVARALRVGLRYPQLVALTAGLFVLDVLIPDVIPFVDEVLLGLVTLLLAGRKRRDKGAAPA